MIKFENLQISNKFLKKSALLLLLLLLILPLTVSAQEITDNTQNGETIRIGLFADPHVGVIREGANQSFRELVEEANEKDLDLGIIKGDLVDWATGKNWELYDNIYQDFEFPVFNVVGNHDWRGDIWDVLYGFIPLDFLEPGNEEVLGYYYDNLIPRPNHKTYEAIENLDFGPSKADYRFDYGPLHIVVLDSGYDLYSESFRMQGSAFSDEQIKWLRDGLKDEENIIITMHHQFYNRDSETFGVRYNAKEMENILREEDVLAFLHGHLHDVLIREIDGVKHISTDNPSSYQILEFDQGEITVENFGEPFAHEWGDLRYGIQTWAGAQWTHLRTLEGGFSVFWVVVFFGSLILLSALYIVKSNQ